MIFRGPVAAESGQTSKTERLKQILGLTKTNDVQHAPSEPVATGHASKVERLKNTLGFTKKAAVVPEGEGICMAERFKRAFSRTVTVHFVGAWDTVSSVGGMRADEVLPGTTDGMTHVCFFRHALALDERRVKFMPEYAWGGVNLPPPNRRSQADIVARTSGPPQVLEVWFGGTHSDIGGGNVDNVELNRRRPSLRWMASEAASLGLRLQSFKRELWASEQVDVRESLKGFWHILELFPFQRYTFSRNPGKINCITRKPHLGSPRKIHEGQKIHSSLLLSETHTPKARPPPGLELTFWAQLHKAGLSNKSRWLEVDISDHVRMLLVKRFIGEDDSKVEEELETLTETKRGAQTLYDEVIEALRSLNGNQQGKIKLLQTTIDILERHSRKMKLGRGKDVWSLLMDLMMSEHYWRLAERFQRKLAQNNALLELVGHTDSVLGVAISPDGKRIISCSKDRSIRIWKMDTGRQLGRALRGHEDWVTSVAISRDGQHIVSASSDCTIRIWDEKGKPVGLLEGHIAWVTSIAITPDSKHIVSGSDDETIRVWDLEKVEQVGRSLLGHRDSITSIAITPDGNRIISGSRDNTIRTWDTRMRKEVVGKPPIPGHKYWVGSIAMMPDGNFVSAGNNTICVWDAKLGVQMGPGQGMGGHRSCVNSIAISSDAKYIASGSEDETIRVWNVATKTQVGVLLGHTGGVNSVTITANRKRIVSSSDDRTVRIWDAGEFFD